MSPKKIRLTVALVIAGFWILMMAWLAQRELGGRVVTVLNASATLPAPSDIRLGVFLPNGQQVGQARFERALQQRHDEGGTLREGTLMSIDARANLTFLGRATEIDLKGEVWRPLSARSADFQFDVASSHHKIHVGGQVDGGRLRAEVESGDEKYPIDLPIDDDLIFSSGLGTALEFPRLAVGEEIRLESFDPMTLQKSKLRVRCMALEMISVLGKDVPTRRLKVESGGLTSQVWVSEGGEVLQAQVPLGLTLRRIPAE